MDLLGDTADVGITTQLRMLQHGSHTGQFDGQDLLL